MAHCKASSGLPISVNWTFLLSVTAEALWANTDCLTSLRFWDRKRKSLQCIISLLEIWLNIWDTEVQAGISRSRSPPRLCRELLFCSTECCTGVPLGQQPMYSPVCTPLFCNMLKTTHWSPSVCAVLAMQCITKRGCAHIYTEGDWLCQSRDASCDKNRLL